MPRFQKQRLKFAAISYDSEEILKFFSDRHKALVFPARALRWPRQLVPPPNVRARASNATIPPSS
ncbi:MAG: hypothetical protein DMG41_20055 [Acidobacteria bacterium]|nr:MAG: hypothetical protein DMG42_21945 [Acidobacteriota bacterium]PYT86303.1 MAG: hypothetical protein DMG41_20055 [Acidobacteriota bacterium]